MLQAPSGIQHPPLLNLPASWVLLPWSAGEGARLGRALRRAGPQCARAHRWVLGWVLDGAWSAGQCWPPDHHLRSGHAGKAGGAAGCTSTPTPATLQATPIARGWRGWTLLTWCGASWGASGEPEQGGQAALPACRAATPTWHPPLPLPARQVCATPEKFDAVSRGGGLRFFSDIGLVLIGGCRWRRIWGGMGVATMDAALLLSSLPMPTPPAPTPTTPACLLPPPQTRCTCCRRRGAPAWRAWWRALRWCPSKKTIVRF